MHARRLAPQREAEREGRLQLPGEAQREPDGADARGAQPRREHVHDVGVERVALGVASRDLLGRREGEWRPVAREVELQRAWAAEIAEPASIVSTAARVLLAVEEPDGSRRMATASSMPSGTRARLRGPARARVLQLSPVEAPRSSSGRRGARCSRSASMGARRQERRRPRRWRSTGSTSTPLRRNPVRRGPPGTAPSDHRSAGRRGRSSRDAPRVARVSPVGAASSTSGRVARWTRP
jgi:hypothetical protein